ERGESAAEILRREMKVPSPTVPLEIEDATYQFILSRTIHFGESVTEVLRRELNLGGPAPEPEPEPEPEPIPSGTIVFRIKAGTGIQPWNLQEDMIRTTVGSVLRVFNDDAVPHRLHTNGMPF